MPESHTGKDIGKSAKLFSLFNRANAHSVAEKTADKEVRFLRQTKPVHRRLNVLAFGAEKGFAKSLQSQFSPETERGPCFFCTAGLVFIIQTTRFSKRSGWSENRRPVPLFKNAFKNTGRLPFGLALFGLMPVFTEKACPFKGLYLILARKPCKRGLYSRQKTL